MIERDYLDESYEEKNKESPDHKIEFQENGIDFLAENSQNRMKMMGGFDENAVKTGNSVSQELTLSYLCENSKLGMSEKDFSGKNLLNSLEKLGSVYKGKEILVFEDQIEMNNNLWVERDFLQLNENRGNSSKREADNEKIEGENVGKKPKVESLNLSLALPEVSFSLAGSNRIQNGDLPDRLRPSRSVMSLVPSYNNATTTYSNDYTAASLSYSHSHPFSHNPSCSLTRNSTENFEYSVGSHRRECDQIWNCGEGTNGSVHSRFRPIGDGTVVFSNHEVGGGGFGLGDGGRINKDSCNSSLYKTTSSDNHSFFPSELPARPRIDSQSGEFGGRGSDGRRDLENVDGGGARELSRPEKILREIVSESIPVMAQIIQELNDETVESTKEYLENLINMPERKDELLWLQKRLERRSDFTNETLSKCHKKQLEILVAIKMGLGSFLSGKSQLPTAELVDIFLLQRCRNINCKRLLPVDDCDCKICSTKQGFCSECMCPVCLTFDCANNTCSWVGCDLCSHWCHAACALRSNFIKQGPCVKGPSRTTEMQFHCPGCGHASEMFGFIKDVFMNCAKDWDAETMIKECDCVRKIFRGSEDRKGQELHVKANEMLTKLENKIMTPSDVCNFIFQFFSYTDGLLDSGALNILSKDLTNQSSLGTDASVLPLSSSRAPKTSFHDTSTSSGRQELMPFDLHQNDIKFPLVNDKIIEDEWSVKPAKKDGFDSLESLVRIKEAEARMFKGRADEARREAESIRNMVRMKTEKLEQEYTEKLADLCLQETEERQRKKLEELKESKNSHCDYYNMKLRMQSKITGLLKRLESTKQQLV
ncbi:OBERON 3 [Olea europaea subsp. europaea]|uniref:OBERON 3 n=2 Tax=Olea europaea subsp. europaea TaxID=158383 RepID=A0A8S0USY5_OLEEU|nr:OBERON 3 [Olea europaea subsp. europaea]